MNFKHILYSLPILVLSALFSTGASHAATATLTPSADVSTNKLFASMNYGSSSTLYSYYDLSSRYSMVTYLKFDLSSIPARSLINSAKLRLYSNRCADSRGGSVTLAAYVNTGDWTENGLTANDPMFYLPIGGSSSVSGSGYKEWSVTTPVKEWLGGVRRNYGLSLRNYSETYDCRFNSREAASNKPQLVVNYTPIAVLDVDLTKPVISNVAVGNFTTSSVKVTWKTDENSDSHVEYYKDGGAIIINRAGQNDSVTNHSVSVQGLFPGTNYKYRVKSKDAAGNEAATAWSDFRTNNLVLVVFPEVSNLKVAALSATSATITWDTDINADSYVEYGLSDSIEPSSKIKDESVRQHSVTLSDLVPNSDYKYRVKLKSTLGTTRFTDLKYFSTPAASDDTPPTISNIKVKDISETSATVTWTTSEKSTSWVFYTLSADDATPFNEYPYHQGRNDDVTSHSVVLEGLDSNTLYNYRVVSLDSSSNTAASVRKTFKTLEEPSAVDSGTGTSGGAAGTTPDSTSGTGDSGSAPAGGSAPEQSDGDWNSKSPAGASDSGASTLTPDSSESTVKAAYENLFTDLMAKAGGGFMVGLVLLILTPIAFIVFLVLLIVIVRHLMVRPKIAAHVVLAVIGVTSAWFIYTHYIIQNDRKLEQALKKSGSFASSLKSEVAGTSTTR